MILDNQIFKYAIVTKHIRNTQNHDFRRQFQKGSTNILLEIRKIPVTNDRKANLNLILSYAVVFDFGH